MFWIGKSLLHLKLFDDAKTIFRDMKRDFASSPLIKYVDKELERLEKTDELPVPTPAIAKGEEKYASQTDQPRNRQIGRFA